MKRFEFYENWKGAMGVAKTTLKPPPGLFALPAAVSTAILIGLLMVFLVWVKLEPQVEESFFFSKDDPNYATEQIISGLFPQLPQLIIAARGDIHSSEYRTSVSELSDEILDLEPVFSVQSLSHGPDDVEDALESPLWKRILVSDREDASFISAFVDETSPDNYIPDVEKICSRHQSDSFDLMISGAPYIMEKIRRNLVHDLQIFSIAAFVIFGAVLLFIFRSVRILAGMLMSCLISSMLTLIVVQLIRVPIGPLTANLFTIIFVLTLTHMVFMTFNWKSLKNSQPASEDENRRRAVGETLKASFWSMLTTLLGFLSLLFVQAEPLRQLGLSGAIGTVIAMSCAYLVFPAFLLSGSSKVTAGQSSKAGSRERADGSFFGEKHGWIVGILLCFGVLVSGGIFRINIDPSLFSYFKDGGELRNGLEYIDRHGGSSALKIVLVDKEGASFNTGEAYSRLWKLHLALEALPGTGNVVSLPIILAEAKRSPFSVLLTNEWLIKILESKRFGEVAKYFITEDREKTFFIVRMKEGERSKPRSWYVQNIKDVIESHGFAPVLIGGVYMLQGQLADLLGSSLLSGLGLLVAVFVVMGAFLSRSVKVTLAMLVSLISIPVIILGVVGFFRVPFDVISAPAANLAIAMGVDSMIHMLFFVRSHRGDDMSEWKVWSQACRHLWKPVMASMFVICAGFGIFLFSGFPPTQRFGFSVLFGSMIATAIAMLVLPFLATLKMPAGKRPRPKR